MRNKNYNKSKYRSAPRLAAFCIAASMIALIATLAIAPYLVSTRGQMVDSETDGNIDANNDFTAPKFNGAWGLRHPATKHQIEGYASLSSVAPGNSIGLDVSCSTPAQFKTDIFRMGYYNGAGALLVGQLPYTHCNTQHAPTIDRFKGMVD